jgi:hypothetical protein
LRDLVLIDIDRGGAKIDGVALSPASHSWREFGATINTIFARASR